MGDARVGDAPGTASLVDPAGQAENERARIIEATYRLLLVSDGQNVSVTDILHEAGLSTRAFYRHFGSKDALLLALFRQESEALRTRLDSLVASAASPVEALRDWIEDFLRVAAPSRRLASAVALSAEEISRARGYAAAQLDSQAAQEATLATVLARGRADGSFPWAEPGPDARWIRAAVSQAFADRLREDGSVPEVVAQLVDFALRAVGAGRP